MSPTPDTEPIAVSPAEMPAQAGEPGGASPRGIARSLLDPTLEQTRRIAALVGPSFVVLAVVLVPWTAYLYVELPSRQLSHNYDLAWAGFDIGLAVALGSTTWALVRLSRALPIAASALGTLLVVDAWFDVLTSRPGQALDVAVAMAVVVELPLAAIAYWLAYFGQALREREIGVRLLRIARSGRPVTRASVRPILRRPRG